MKRVKLQLQEKIGEIRINYFTREIRIGRPGFNPRSSYTNDSKMVFDAALLNTQHYKEMIKEMIKGKVEQSRE